MKKNIIVLICSLIAIVLIIIGLLQLKANKKEVNNLEGQVIYKDKDQITIQDDNQVIYTFKDSDITAKVGENVLLTYSGILNKNTQIQENEIVKYTLSENVSNLNENDIFGAFYKLAKDKLNKLTLEEKIAQILLVRYPNSNQIDMVKNYKPAGIVFFEKDFKDKDKSTVQKMIKDLQDNANIPLLTAVDEEGGKVVRVSSNPKLASSKFKSSSDLYNNGGLQAIKEDTINKSAVLKELGLNVNLAPVVDVSTDANAYMYERTLKQDTKITSNYAKSVIESSKNTGVSYTLKHFPGYGNNSDTHINQAIDNRTYEDLLKNDLPPFEAGINSGAEAVLVSHNIVSTLDANTPASLSVSVHNLLRNKLNFTGVVITDDLDMGATSSIKDKNMKALMAGNDLIITTNYQESFKEIKDAVDNKKISQSLVDNAALKVLAWKYYKGLMFANEK